MRFATLFLTFLATAFCPAVAATTAVKQPQMLQDFESFNGDQDCYGYFAVKYTASFQLDRVNHSPAGTRGWKIIASAAGDGGGGFHADDNSSWNANGYDSVKFWFKPTGRDGSLTIGLRETPVCCGEYWVAFVYMDHRFPQARYMSVPFKRMILRLTEQKDSIFNNQIGELACVVNGSTSGTGFDTVTIDDFQFVAAAPKTGTAGTPGVKEPAYRPCSDGFVRTWINPNAPSGSRLTVARSVARPDRIIDIAGRSIVVRRNNAATNGLLLPSR